MASGLAGGRGHAPEMQALGAHQHTLFSHLKRIFKRKFRP